MTQLQSKTFNGYKNYETWNVSLWLNNEESLYNITRKLSAHQIKSYVTVQFIMNREHNAKGRSFGDLTKKTELNRVDWDEVQQSLTN